MAKQFGIKTVLAILLALVSLLILAGGVFDLPGMLASEMLINPGDPNTTLRQMLTGIQQYCTSFGAILFFAGIGWILLGYNDKVETNPARLTPEDDE